MSFTAQRRDIEDPSIIEEFAKKVGSIARLNDLYVLTVADICATNPNLWNSWRDALLKRLHQLTEQWFIEGEQSLRSIIDSTRSAALEQGAAAKLSFEDLQAWLSRLPDDYFLRTDIAPILKHAQLALNAKSARANEPIVGISDQADQDATQILVLSHNRPGLFAQIVAELDRLRLNVQSANLTLIPPAPSTQTPEPDRALFEFYILDQQNNAKLDTWSLVTLQERLLARLTTPNQTAVRVQRRVPPQMASLDVATHIDCLTDERRERNIIQISTKDRPGLLADITAAFAEQGVVLRHARISTLGERVEDVFYVVDHSGQLIEAPKTCAALQSALRTAIQGRT